MDPRRRYNDRPGANRPFPSAHPMFPMGAGQRFSQGIPTNMQMQQNPNANKQNQQSKESKEELLAANRIVTLERPSPMFPNAKFFCKLCHQHFNQQSTGVDHCLNVVHVRKKTALDLRKVVLAMPRVPAPNHLFAIETELMRIFIDNQMTEKNLKLRSETLKEIEGFIQKTLKSATPGVPEKFANVELKLQGSSLSGVGLSSSDINMDLHLPNNAPLDVQAKVFFAVYFAMTKWPNVTKVEVQLNITVPRIMAFHIGSELNIEISLGSGAALRTNRLLRDYASMDKRVSALIVNLRYWAKQCMLDDPQVGSLPAHSFAIMVIYYLQQLNPPVLPCIHESLKEGEEDYQKPAVLNNWTSQNKLSLAELWLGMLRFYAAEFKVKKFCISIISTKKSLLSARKWTSRYIGIEDPFCKKKSLAKSIVSDQIMTYFLACLRFTYLYFAVPRTTTMSLFDPKIHLDLNQVEDPDGDDIEDGLAVEEEVEEDEEKDDDLAEKPDGLEATEIEELKDLKGWNQHWPLGILEQIARHEDLNYTLGNVQSLTGNNRLPLVCISCRQNGHRSNNCQELKLPKPTAFDASAFEDSRGDHSMLCQYIYENFRPRVSEQELKARVACVKELEMFIQKTIPEAYLTLFGSSRNGFSLDKADLDICLKYKDKEGVDETMDVKDIIVRVSQILESHPHISDVQAIASAKVPIVKFHHDAFGVDGDISLYNVLAEHNTAMLKAYSEIDERVVHLGAALKQYVKICDMGDASRGSLSSYAYVVMLIHYLQIEKVVPVLQQLPPIGHPKGADLPTIMIDGWNAYYFKDIDRLSEVWPHVGGNKKTVGQLWLGLIDFYARQFQFDFHVVCIRQLTPLTRLEKMWTNKSMCVEDPFELDHNLGTGISVKMAKYIFSALITSRNWFLRTPEKPLKDTEAIYKHFMNARELTVGNPPKDRGCKRCGKIGHWIKDCPVKANQSDKRAGAGGNRRVCHTCKKPGHVMRDCPERLGNRNAPQQQHQQQQSLQQQRSAQMRDVFNGPSYHHGHPGLHHQNPTPHPHQSKQQPSPLSSMGAFGGAAAPPSGPWNNPILNAAAQGKSTGAIDDDLRRVLINLEESMKTPYMAEADLLRGFPSQWQMNRSNPRNPQLGNGLPQVPLGPPGYGNNMGFMSTAHPMHGLQNQPAPLSGPMNRQSQQIQPTLAEMQALLGLSPLDFSQPPSPDEIAWEHRLGAGGPCSTNDLIWQNPMAGFPFNLQSLSAAAAAAAEKLIPNQARSQDPQQKRDGPFSNR